MPSIRHMFAKSEHCIIILCEILIGDKAANPESLGVNTITSPAFALAIALTIWSILYEFLTPLVVRERLEDEGEDEDKELKDEWGPSPVVIA